MQDSVDNRLSWLGRVTMVMPLAALFTILLFSVLARLTSTGEAELAEAQDLPTFDFILQPQESELNIRQRERLPVPEEIVEPQKMPELPPVITEPVPVSATKPKVNVPRLNINMNLDVSPALADINASQIVRDIPVKLAFDSNPTVLKRIAPRYPSRALRKKIEGHILVEFLVTKAGDVKGDSLKVIESEPKGVFDKAVLRSIKRWRFKSKVIDGKPVAYKARQRLEFKLNK